MLAVLLGFKKHGSPAYNTSSTLSSHLHTHLDEEDLGVGGLPEAQQPAQGSHQAAVVQVAPVRIAGGWLVLGHGVYQGVASAGVLKKKTADTGRDGAKVSGLWMG